MTNKEYLLNLDDYELADYLINISTRYETYDDYNDPYDVYTDPEGNEWFIYEDAIEATIEWLNKEVNE